MTYLINNNSSIFANFSNHYETPTLNELSNDPDSASIGGFNSRLNPQVSNSFEIGLKGYVRDVLFYEFSLYRSKIDNEITSFELESSPGKTYYRNVGETQKEGIEVSLSTNLGNNIRADFAYTYSQFEFSNYIKNNQDLNGNRLPGLPQNLFNTDIYYINPKGYFMVMGFSRYSNIYLNDSNDQTTNP